MYSLYRRHEAACRFRKQGIRAIKCSCPIWLDGADERGARKRYSLKTRSWTLAQERVIQLENGTVQTAQRAPDSPLLEAAASSFLDDCRARRLQPSTLASYTKTLEYLCRFFAGQRVSQIDLNGLTRFRASRTIATAAGEARAVSASTSTKEIQVLRFFFRFCAARKWVAENHAIGVKPPKVDRVPTLPFTEDEIDKILKACDEIGNRETAHIDRARSRARALILTLLYSGFRISDAVKLERSAVDMKTGKLLVRMMKTRSPLYIRLPKIALDALAAVPVEGAYFFWNGKSKLTSEIGVARVTIDRVLKCAGVVHGHPHRFRDTFSVTLLQNGAELHTVQLLLGHTSIKTTEKHYAPFVVSMQRILDEAVSTLHFGSAVPDALAQHVEVRKVFPRHRHKASRQVA